MSKSDKKKAIKRFPRLASKAETEHQAQVRIIEEKCSDFGAPGRVVKVSSGPIVTQYEFAPNKYTRFRKLKTLNEDLAMALEVSSVAINQVVGASTAAIMVPNAKRQDITFDGTMPEFLKARKTMDLPMNLGIDSMGRPMIIDLTKMPHCLIAGETNSGKSVLLNTIISSLCYTKSPKELQLLLVDSKQVELTPYKDIPHASNNPIARDVWDALKMMEKAEQEMRRRMTFLELKGVKNLKELNEKLEPAERLPYVVMVIDELADMMLQEKKLFTQKLAILAGMARAAGIHIIAATQRPSVDVLSGKIKVNFPARIAFHVPSAGDSKTILDVKGSGAHQLEAKGDAFAILPGFSGLQRIHTPWTKEADIRKLIRASTMIGFTLKAPVDLTEKERVQLEKELNVSAAKMNDSIADAMFKGFKVN